MRRTWITTAVQDLFRTPQPQQGYWRLRCSRSFWIHAAHWVRPLLVIWILGGGSGGRCLAAEGVTDGHTQIVFGVAFSPDGRLLASVGADKVVLWDVDTRRPAPPLQETLGGGSGLAFSPDGTRLAVTQTVKQEQTVTLWEVATRTRVGTLHAEQKTIGPIAFRPDGRWLVAGTEISTEQHVTVWDVQKQQLVTPLQGHKDAVRSLAFRPDGKVLASGAADGTIILWDLTAQKQLHTLHAAPGGIAFSPQGHLLASGSGEQVILWDVQSQQKVAVLQGHAGNVGSVAFSPDGKILASGGRDGTILVWDAETYQKRSALKQPKGFVNALAVSPDSKLLASGGGDLDFRAETKTLVERGELHLWDLSTRQHLVDLNATAREGRNE